MHPKTTNEASLHGRHFRRLDLGTAAGILLATAVGLSSSTASAANFNVSVPYDAVDDNPGDCLCEDAGGLCTLRAAVMEANACPGGDDIFLGGGTHILTIGGSAGASQGDLDFDASGGSVSLHGAGPFLSTVDMVGGSDRVFDLASGSNVFIEGIDITGGRAQQGGGVRSLGRLSMLDVVLHGNSASTGGGIFVGGETELFDTEVANNNAESGGGVFVVGSLYADALTISANFAGVSGSGFGGALYIQPTGEVEVNNGDIAGNTSSYRAGAILNQGTLDLFRTRIADNEAPRSAGGLWNMAGSTARLSECWVLANRTRRIGGGILNSGDLFVEGTTFRRNNADLRGGAIAHLEGLLNPGAVAVIVRSALTENQAEDGAAIDFVGGEMVLLNSTIAANRGGSGGGMRVRGGSVEMTNVTVVYNQASIGAGGIDNAGSSTAVSVKNMLLGANAGPQADCSGALTSFGNNIVGDTTACTVAPTDNILNPSTLGLAAPVWQVLPGQDHVPIVGSSPAIDFADPLVCNSPNATVDLATDQLGQARVGICDVGAFEHS